MLPNPAPTPLAGWKASCAVSTPAGAQSMSGSSGPIPMGATGKGLLALALALALSDLKHARLVLGILAKSGS